jgi:flagellar basal-body rod protein FlgF
LDSGYYAACSALKTQTNALEIAANNIANVSTTGYRGQIPSFHSLLASTAGSQMSGWERRVNEFAVLNSSRLDLGQGNLEPTGNPLDFAVEGAGFFAVQTKGGTLYTRNGSFKVAASGQLQSFAGDPVLGVSGPITVPGGAISISPDGTVSVNGAVAGKLRIAEFAASTALTPAGASYYAAPEGAAKPAIASFVRQGMLESSNVSPVAAMVGLISAQRQAEMVERAMTAFYADFNRIAADELPRT